MIFLTKIKALPPRADLSLLKVVKSTLKASKLLIFSWSHDSVPIRHRYCTCQLNSRSLMFYYEHTKLYCSTVRDLTSVLHADASAIDLTLDVTSTSLLFKLLVLVTSQSSSCIEFWSSIDDRRFSLVLLVLWLPFSKLCHFLFPARHPTSSPLTLAYTYPSRLFPLPFRRSPFLAKSPSSIQLFGSTKLSPPKAFATQNTSTYNIYCSQHVSGNMKICMYWIYE